jgi:hypothetical protein
MEKIGKYIGIACLLYLAVCVTAAIIQTQNVQQAQPSEAPRSLPLTGQCATNDLSIVACSAPDAVMTMDDFKSKVKTLCNLLDDKKLSDMSPKQLRIQGACREVAARHLWD